MRVGLFVVLTLLGFSNVYARDEAIRVVELPEGVYEEYENGSLWWEKASSNAVIDYHRSTVSTWFCSLTSLFPILMVINTVSQHSPHSAPMARLLFAGLAFTDFAFLCSDGVALVQSSRQLQPVFHTLPFQDRKRAPLLIQVIVGVLPFNMQYRIHSLWQTGISDSDYGDDEYLDLAKVLSRNGQYLRLSGFDIEDEESESATSRLLERTLKMEVHQVGGNDTTQVLFEEASPRRWIEPYLLNLSELEDSDELYQATISPEWMAHIAQWLSAHPDVAVENEVIRVEMGSLSSETFDDEFDDRFTLVKGKEGCLSLDMDGMQWNLPKEGILFSSDGCFSLGHSSANVSLPGSHVAQNERDSRYYLYKDKALKQFMVTAFNGVMGKALEYGISKLFGNNRQPVFKHTTEVFARDNKQLVLKRNIKAYQRDLDQQIVKSQTGQFSYIVPERKSSNSL
ncbi:hypothetical protein [Endozoicomonas numazuensis]|uniref:Uncharacterized protein n=1 Tax=Endozoicomonas numazuensis TaxID=1137799 RepID=A0A081NFM0_9GAMM|nr:hypothetical protein [Endozoicomonas numazuensis]KEQ17243.1 hypothetical protein GZ78_15550 [Endozoicomonas numazuensis]